jgi:hypothetical protein
MVWLGRRLAFIRGLEPVRADRGAGDGSSDFIDHRSLDGAERDLQRIELLRIGELD